MKISGRILLTAFALTFAPEPLLAQTTQTDDIVSLAASSQGLPQVAFADVPRFGGTYWWVLPAVALFRRQFSRWTQTRSFIRLSPPKTSFSWTRPEVR